MVALTTMIGLGKTAAFEFHLSNWLGAAGGLPVRPEVERLPAASTLCVYGRDDASSLCAQLGPTHARVVELPGGHHFGGDYDAVARLILQQLDSPSGARG
jgi:type IV secretory pathway VirJ component